MLEIRKQEDKTFEEWMEEALLKIPLYSREWTNFQPSDPGITILENFIAFHVLQQSQIQKTSPEVLEKLLKFAGITPVPAGSARVLLEAKNLKEHLTFPEQQQFLAGGIPFETDKQIHAGMQKLLAVYGVEEGKILDAGVLLQPEIPMSIKIFGDKPKAGNAVYFITDSIPDQEVHFYIRTIQPPFRNAFVESAGSRFAHISWQYYTKDGFRDIRCRDHTWCFLTDGELLFRGIRKPEIYEKMPVKGYCIRGVLTKADYDIPPKLLSVHGLLLEAFQKKTGCTVKSFDGSAGIELNCSLLKDGYFRVFCREGEGKSYRRYEPANEDSGQGRYYAGTRKGESQLEIKFDRERFGSGPMSVRNAVRVVIYTEEMMRRYDLGIVYGYDHQEIQLPVQHIVKGCFCLLAQRQRDSGGFYYDFVKPGQTEDGDLNYELLEEEGMIRIRDPGDFIKARLFLAEIADCLGEAGNVRENSLFAAEGDFGRAEYLNPAPAAGGRFKESLAGASKRFYQEMKKPETAVCAQDYEEMARKVSGLCIHKVRAFMDEDEKMVLVAVKPWSEEEFPKLTPLYRKILEQYFEPRRILTTRIRFVNPRYVGVDVRGVIYVKRQYECYREEIEGVLRKHLDYRMGAQNFGEVLEFQKLFWDLAQLTCVASVQNLAIYPQNLNAASLVGMDIHPGKNCLCYPGVFHLDIHAGSLGGT